MRASLLPDRGPNLICIGAPKAGTTWLAQVLAAHPQVFMPPQKELNALHYEDLDQRLNEYAAYFEPARDELVRCDFSVRYMASPRAAEAAARLAPDARILAVLRDPADQIQSHYWHLRRQNFHQPATVSDPPDLFAAIERFPVLLLEPALYAKHLSRWLTHFPRERILLLDHAELVANPRQALSQICEFCDLGAFDFAKAIAAVDASDARGGVQPRGGVIGAAFPSLYVAVSRGPYHWLKRMFGVQAAEALKRRLRLRQVAESVFFQPGYPKLDAAGRARLRSYVADDLAHLSDLTGFDPAWARSR